MNSVIPSSFLFKRKELGNGFLPFPRCVLGG